MLSNVPISNHFSTTMRFLPISDGSHARNKD